jgi:hypothetical protein
MAGEVVVIAKLLPKNNAFIGLVDAEQAIVDTDPFSGALGVGDDTVQKALETLDQALGALPAGIAEGDIIRWNATGGVWEVVSEPFEFSEIVLTPKASSSGAEGTIFYCSGDKSVYVGVQL